MAEQRTAIDTVGTDSERRISDLRAGLIRFFGESVVNPYGIAFDPDYTVAAGETSGAADVLLYRDGHIAASDKSGSKAAGTDTLSAEEPFTALAYLGIYNEESGCAVAYPAESTLFGDAVGFGELYENALFTGYDKCPALKRIFGDAWAPLFAYIADARLAANDAVKDAGEALDANRHYVRLAETSLLYAQDTATGDYDAYCAAATARYAHNAALKSGIQANNAFTKLDDAIDALNSKIAEGIAGLSLEIDTAFCTAKLTGALHDTCTAFAEEAELLAKAADIQTAIDAAVTATVAAFTGTPVGKNLNGIALADYVLFSDTDPAVARMFTDGMLTAYNILIPTVPLELRAFVTEADLSRALVFDATAPVAVYGQSVIEKNESGSTVLYGDGQNGVYFAMLKLLAQIEGDGNIMIDRTITVKASDVTDKTYAVDTFFRADGTLDTDSTAPLTIVCLGGSLTELGSKWVTQVGDYFAKRFPNRTVTVYNAGVGGTGSSFGATRFQLNVLDKNPDLVLIEFNVNDCGSGELGSKAYMESMIYQCLQQEKIPGVIFGFTPAAIDKESAKYPTWYNQVLWKTEIAGHYGISCVNIYDYFYRTYEAAKIANPALTYLEYVSDIYRRDDNNPLYGDIYDVHPIASGRGYDLYAQAFIEAFDARLPEMLTRLRHTDIYCATRPDIVRAAYRYIPCTDARLTYDTGEWETWTADTRYSNADTNSVIGTSRYKFPFFADGIRRAYKQAEASFTFTTTANSIALYYHAAKSGATATVYVNGVSCGTFKSQSTWQQPFCSSFVSLDNAAHEEVTVRVVIPPATDTEYSYAFGYVVEKFTGN